MQDAERQMTADKADTTEQNGGDANEEVVEAVADYVAANAEAIACKKRAREDDVVDGEPETKKVDNKTEVEVSS
jgi:hypothetical protein